MMRKDVSDDEEEIQTIQSRVQAARVEACERRWDAVGHAMDIAPTFLDMAGASYPASNEKGNLVPPRGKSMMPFLTAEAASIREQGDYLAWKFIDWHTVRTAAWKATWIRKPFGSGKKYKKCCAAILH